MKAFTFTSMLAAEKVAGKDKELVVRADRNLFAWLLVIWEKREVSMKDFLRYSLDQSYGLWLTLFQMFISLQNQIY